MAKKKRVSGGVDPTSGLPIVEGLDQLDPVTNLPVDTTPPAINKQYNIPDGDWDMRSIINDQTLQDFGNNRYNRPGVIQGNVYGM